MIRRIIASIKPMFYVRGRKRIMLSEIDIDEDQQFFLYKIMLFYRKRSMYCVKCKKATDTSNVQFAVSKNGRNMKRGTCVICGTTKTQFIKAQEGGSLLNKAINNLPFEMHLPGHNFTGPGTNLKKRLNSDLTLKKWSKPVNRVDKAAYHHDVCYLKKR